MTMGEQEASAVEHTTLRSGFLRSLVEHGDRPALRLAESTLSYRELDSLARSFAATLEAHKGDDTGTDSQLTAVFGHRHVSAIAGVLASLYRGHGYVPLNPSFPTDRSRSMVERARVGALIVDPTALGQLPTLLEGLDRPLTILVPGAEDLDELSSGFPLHRFLGTKDLVDGAGFEPLPVTEDDIAYLLFTSGSTGIPKGVMVAHRNVVAFITSMVERYSITEEDKFSNTFDLTFDLSVFDLFCAWERGACVCVPTAQQKMFPGKWVKKEALTVWFSVPSTGVLMSRLRMLKPDAYPSLRWTLFCGEALPLEIVERFAAAAPASMVENLYGPTELTIACTLYRWKGESSKADCVLGLVPIGDAYPGMKVLIADEHQKEVPRGDSGELLMTGVQMTPGYWEDEARTAAAFMKPPGLDEVYYRTGDRVRWPLDGPMVYLGRIDNQIKIQGYRVELGEVEAKVREASSADVVIAVGWPRTASGADGIVAFIADKSADSNAILARSRELLPGYMQPQRIILIDDFPLNSNGKVDRKALLAQLQEQS